MNTWYGYKHTDGSYQAKRYFTQQDLTDCQESDFVEAYTQPFQAEHREEALEITEQRLG